MVKQLLIGLRFPRSFGIAALILLGTLTTTSPTQAQFNREEIADPPAPAHLAVPSFPRPSDAEAKIIKRLSEPASVNWNDKSLEEALNDLEDRVGIEIWLDKQALADDGIHTDQEISLRIDGVSLRTCLRLILEPLGLVYVVEDEVMKITTYTKTESKQTTRIYPVGDLCETPDEATQLLETIECGLGKHIQTPEGPRLVVSSKLKTLTVRASYVVQEQVQILLLALRDAQVANNPAPQLRNSHE